VTSRNDFVDPRVGLCAECRHADVVRSARSTFYRCRRSFTDARFPKYPALPVVECAGFEPHDRDRGGPARDAT
jgi:hypothetical protein